MSDVTSQTLASELAELREQLALIQSEVAAIRHPRSTEDRISIAVAELRAIVYATETATNGILAVAEAIDSAAESIPRAASEGSVDMAVEQIHSLVASLFTECAFQDITGQRVSRVVTTLEFVEQRVGTIIQVLGDSFDDMIPPNQGPSGGIDGLLNGPSRSGGVSQADIDSLFG
jgi:chemotaxis protein CheZ